MRYDHISMLPDGAFKPIGKSMALHGGKGGKAPKAPDYTKLAEMEAQNQQELLQQQVMANRVNQYGPLGSVTYSQAEGSPTFDQVGYDNAMKQYQQQLASSRNYGTWGLGGLGGMGDTGGGMSGSSSSSSNLTAPDRNSFMRGGTGNGQWSQTTTLTPEMQKVLDQNISAKQQGYDQLQTSLGNIKNNLPQGPINPGQTAQDAIYARLTPEMDRQREALRSQLANQGLNIGSEAYQNEMDRFGRQSNDAYSQAALQGIGLDFQNRNQALTEQGIPINLINAYQSGGQAQMPNFTNYAQQGVGQSADLMGAAQNSYGADMNKYNAGQAQDANTTQGLIGLAGTAAMFGF